jgi:hypothetical protein
LINPVCRNARHLRGGRRTASPFFSGSLSYGDAVHIYGEFYDPKAVKVESLMTKRKHTAGTAGNLGNVRSSDNPGPARPWTDEEMAAAEPLPLQTVNSPEKARTSGVVHAGKGETKPAGRPEQDGRRQGK